jgi:hypothetical protein
MKANWHGKGSSHNIISINSSIIHTVSPQQAEVKGFLIMKEIIIIVGILFFVIAVFIESWMKRKYNIDRKGNPLSKPIKMLQFSLLTICFILYLVTLSTLLIKYDEFNALLVLFLFFIVISFIRGFIQWKYNRRANIWMQEISGAIIFTILIIIFGFVFYY